MSEILEKITHQVADNSQIKSPKTYSKEEVYKDTLEYFNGDELATNVWINKYCLKDSEGNLYEKNPDEMHWRIAKELHRIESKYPNSLSVEEIYTDLKKFKKIIPAGSPMSGIGNPHQINSLSNCFVIGNEIDSDSYGGIMKLDQETAQLQKRRGGVGLDLSFIRPKGSPVKNSALTSTGIVPFMERYSNTTKEVAQDGRRGALMLSLDIRHPDAEDFIDAKMEKGKVTGANISVKLIDDFMNAVKNGKNKFIQYYPVDNDFGQDHISKGFQKRVENDDFEYNKIYRLYKGFYAKVINPQDLWKKIIHNAWKRAEPGILFWDTIINESVADSYADLGYKTISTNPCGEITLCARDSCRLLALNLFGFVVNPFTEDAYFDWFEFTYAVRRAQRYMDDIVDLEIEKIEEIIKKINSDPEDDFIKIYEKDLWGGILDKAKTGRRTGLGITGEGDMLAALGYTYGTDKANEFAEKVQQKLKLNAYKSSVEMAKERGAFPIYDSLREKHNPFINRIKGEDAELYKEMFLYGRRNIALLTIAPTGTVSLMAQITSGIEPVFLPYYKRRRKINPTEKDVRIDFVDEEGIAWTEYTVFHHNFELWLEKNGYDVTVVKSMSGEQIDEIVKQSPYYKATSKDVDWVKKVEMQGMLQKHVDHSISVTVNLPEDVEEEIVAKVYETGWSSGCKGITVYREGSRDGVLITDKEKQNIKKMEIFHDNHAPKRPKRLKANIHKFQNNLEKWIAVVGMKDGRPYEIFTGRLENGLSKLPSYVTECEVVKKVFKDEDGNRQKRYDIEYVDNNGEVITLEGVSHTFNPEYWNYAKMISSVLRHGMPLPYVYELVHSLNLEDTHLNTWKAGVERTIKRYIKNGEKVKGKCSNCGSENLEFKEGCITCASCGWSKCS